VPAQPSGRITLVFTDIEGSTRLLEALGQDAYRDALSTHRSIVRDACAQHAGYEVDCQGDSFFFAFASAPAALEAVEGSMRRLEPGPIRIRVGIHTGEPALDPPRYVGMDVHRAARIMAAGHGGQVLVSEATRGLLGEGVALRDLGEHRLKDLSGPQRLYQLGAGEFPPLKTLHQTTLPVQPTPLVGRERELGELLALLRRDDVRLVTLTGAGGSGKSRLALQVAAAALDDYPDGVWFVPLATLTDPRAVVPAIAQSFGLREGGGRTFDDVLSEYLRQRRLLLVLDNLEQLVPGVAQPLAGLVAEAPRVDLVTSSREPLHIAAEHEYPVPPLDPAEAKALFAERARAAAPGFELDGERGVVGAICDRLDRLPLAIELAAARVKVLTPARLLERLDHRLPLLTAGARDAPERQRTLRATIAWSHDLLDAREQRVFGRLAVFAGGCTLEAAETICDADPDTLGGLIDKNLVRREDGVGSDPRFTMLETIREFAVERFHEMPDAEAVRGRHAEHFFAFVLAVEPELSRRDQRNWLDRLDADHDNVRAAFRRLLDHDDPALALRLALGLFLFWYKRGHVREGRDALVAALDLALPEPSAMRAGALDWTGYFCNELGDDGRPFADRAVACAREAAAPGALALALCHSVAYADGLEEAVALLDEARVLAESAGDRLVLGIALNNLGVMTEQSGDGERACALFEESYRVRAEMGDLAWMSLSLSNLADTAMDLGQVARARAAATQALELAREVGDRRHTCQAVGSLAWIALDEGHPDEARERFVEALGLAHEISNVPNVRLALQGLATVEAVSGEGLLAARLAAVAEPEVHGNTFITPTQSALLERHLAAAQAETDPAEWERAWREGRALTLDEATARVLEAARSPRPAATVRAPALR
jgi:predicted ATPase